MSIKSVPVNKDTFDSLLVRFIDAASQKRKTFSFEVANALAEKVEVLSDDDATPIQKHAARRDLINGIVLGQDNGAYAINDIRTAFKLVTFFTSGEIDPKKEDNKED